MPDVTVIKLKVRRGTEYQRRLVVLEQGELGYTTDTKRLFVGDGILSGGNIVSNITHPPLANYTSLTGLTNAIVGDTVVAASLLYQLTGLDYSRANDWAFIGTQTSSTLAYNEYNHLEIRDTSIEGVKFSETAVILSGGLGIKTTSTPPGPYGLYANVDHSTLTINSSNQIQIKTVNTPVTGFRNLNYNQYGQITDSLYTISNTFTGRSALNSSLSVYNGSPNQVTRHLTFPNQTIIPVLSGSPTGLTTTIGLTAAGFIALESTGSQLGTAVDRFAIPIFSY
jgi:hypothetical protein